MIGLLLAFFTAHAEVKKIYKYTDEEGVTHYSETKLNDNYKEADLPDLTIVPSTPVKNDPVSGNDAGDEKVDPTEVAAFTITKPVKDENLWGTGGKLTASVSPLTAAQQEIYQVQFIIDGEKNKPADGSTQVFEGIYRGEHQVQALLINRFNNKVIKKSQSVTFFMHQNSKK